MVERLFQKRLRSTSLAIKERESKELAERAPRSALGKMVQGLAPISYASTIVGFTSFAFTFFTFVRVFWETILTLWSAPKELERLLDNLRLELHEERAYFKSMLRRQRSRSKGMKTHVDTGPLRLLNDSIKELMNEFKRLEEPFLNEPAEEKEKDVERSDVIISYTHLLQTSPCYI